MLTNECYDNYSRNLPHTWINYFLNMI
uniref:Uncharacterized protein n=1 Tax=Ciona intestinalis TaxID=7719 RepID=F6ZXY6_CIOIN